MRMCLLLEVAYAEEGRKTTTAIPTEATGKNQLDFNYRHLGDSDFLSVGGAREDRSCVIEMAKDIFMAQIYTSR